MEKATPATSLLGGLIVVGSVLRAWITSRANPTRESTWQRYLSRCLIESMVLLITPIVLGFVGVGLIVHAALYWDHGRNVASILVGSIFLAIGIFGYALRGKSHAKTDAFTQERLKDPPVADPSLDLTRKPQSAPRKIREAFEKQINSLGWALKLTRDQWDQINKILRKSLPEAKNDIDDFTKEMVNIVNLEYKESPKSPEKREKLEKANELRRALIAFCRKNPFSGISQGTG